MRRKRKRFLVPIERRPHPPGSPPELLEAPADSPTPKLHAFLYDASGAQEFVLNTPSELRALREAPGILWLDLDGLGDADTIAQIGEVFGLHQLALEDILNSHQRAKVEEYDGHYYVVAHMVSRENETIRAEQLSLFLGKDFVLTFQQWPGDCLNPVRERLRKGSRLLALGPDSLAYAILDALVDGYFPVLEYLGEHLEELENAVMDDPRRLAIGSIHSAKRELLLLRRSIWPLRDALNILYHDDTPLIASETRIYLRDCFDHATRIIDLIETYRELGADLMDVYLSSVSNRINDVMKVLTVITTIFIPLSFIASVYGMNFHNMPELKSKNGYFITLGFMAFVAIGLLLFFFKRGWLRSSGNSR